MIYQTIYTKFGIRNWFNIDEGVLFIIQILLCVLVPYLLGSINSAIILSKKIYKEDIRNFGSGNAGMTNMHRTYGMKAALLTLAGDCAKQIASIFFAAFILGREGAYLAGMFCMLGHIAPVYYKFKGGKGVLTAATMILFLNPVVFLVVFTIFVAVVAVSRYISLGSILSAFAYPGILYMYMTYTKMIEAFPMIASVVISFIVIFMHRSNIARLANGKENKLCLTKKQKQKAEEERLAGKYDDDDDEDINPDEPDENTDYIDTTGVIYKK